MRKLLTIAGKYRTQLRYVLVGGLAFLIEYGSFVIFFSLAGWSVVPANITSFLLGLTTSFILQRYWTFRHAARQYAKSVQHQFTLYACLAGFNLLVSTVLIKLLQHASMDPRLGKIVVMCLVVLWNYYIFNKSIFIKQQT